MNQRSGSAIILAGGFGTRLQDVLNDVPKPLAPVGGRPFLALQMDWLAANGIQNIIITAHYMAEKIADFVSSWAPEGVRRSRPKTHVVVEQNPLGTGGAMVNAYKEMGLSGNTLVLNGDTHYAFELKALQRHHDHCDSPVIMGIASVDNCARYGTVRVADEKVVSFEQATELIEPGLVNCGIYSINDVAISEAPLKAFSVEKDWFPELAAAGRIKVHYINGEEPFYDIGTPESYGAFLARFS